MKSRTMGFLVTDYLTITLAHQSPLHHSSQLPNKPARTIT
jgi:hypothetical protein